MEPNSNGKIPKKKFTWTLSSTKRLWTPTHTLIKLYHDCPPDPQAPLRLITDASEIAYGAVLEQFNANIDKWEPLMFWSKGAKDSEKRWPPYDKELQAIGGPVEI
ncbi:Uncharacterized protein FKW44_000975 [Caligus rogercresseyi]|uniref:Reverse transcriptase/retrotransposon-derived protein RNase H-like domain-containing protein n=1 Tax=Caligus rogercresseyi TaxID=217165 RepID=A0A7T8KI31_CALRO|nr:Uncharacterized protein FKW44_000975 [Caligus rogercresseyi]